MAFSVVAFMIGELVGMNWFNAVFQHVRSMSAIGTGVALFGFNLLAYPRFGKMYGSGPMVRRRFIYLVKENRKNRIFMTLMTALLDGKFS